MRRTLLAGFAMAVSLTACGVSQQQEVEMGTQYAQQINAQLPIVEDAELNRYINVLGDSVARLADNRELEWHFYIVDAPEVNAFAVPGGFIYVNRGLIERTTAMDELAGVLGHEIGHVTRRHSVKQMEKANNANIGVTLACVLTSICNSDAAQAAIQVGGAAVFARFSRQDEAEADAEGIKNVVRANISPDGIPTMFEKLLQERKNAPAGVEAWFLTHPLEEDRIAATRAQIAQIDPAVRRTLTRDSQRYQQFKARLAALPPSPVRQAR